MQQYFIKGQVENPVIIKDKDTVKHMFNVMRLTEDDQVVLVFEDGIKRLARVTDRENHVFEVIENLNDKYFKIKDCLSRCGNGVIDINNINDSKNVLFSFLNSRIYLNN